MLKDSKQGYSSVRVEMYFMFQSETLVNMHLRNVRLLEIIIFHIFIYFLLSIYITFYNSSVRNPPFSKHKQLPFIEHGAPAFHTTNYDSEMFKIDSKHLLKLKCIKRIVATQFPIVCHPCPHFLSIFSIAAIVNFLKKSEIK